jgi:hypothetical protein
MAPVLFLIFLGWALQGPSDHDIELACKAHGRVVSYSGASLFTLDAASRVVCSDGTVHEVRRND